MSYKLSICIPTYNRAKYLSETLDSIIHQATDEIEIVISDNASTDNTDDIINMYKIKFPSITYHKNNENIGPDRNYQEVIKHAKGEYCWFFGSDDAIKSNALKRILDEIKSGADIYLCNRTDCDINLNPQFDNFWLSDKISDKTYNFSNVDELLDYFNSAQLIGALFSYLSCIIFKRDRWEKVNYDGSFDNTGYSHVAIFFSFLRHKCQLRYLRDRLVYCRSGNDSFMQKGRLNRMLVDIDGYTMIADRIISNNLKEYFLKALINEYPWYRIIRLCSLTSEKDWPEIRNKLIKAGFDNNLLGICRYFGVTLRPIIPFFVKIKCKIVKNTIIRI